MSILIAGEDYRPIHKWKYLVLRPQSVKVEDLPAFGFKDYAICMGDTLTAKPHYAWDGASFIARDTDNIMRASLFHDILCQVIAEGLLDKKYRKYADQLFRKICLEDGMSKFRAWYVYMAVRAYSKLKGM